MSHVIPMIVLLECKQRIFLIHVIFVLLKFLGIAYVLTENLTSAFLFSDLGNAELSGKLVPQLGQLKKLQYLYVLE